MTSISDPFTEAIKEAYASNEEGKVILSTIEIYPDSLSTPARLVLGYRDFTATLESTAPVDPSTEVTFQKCMFKVSLPDSQDSLPDLTL